MAAILGAAAALPARARAQTRDELVERLARATSLGVERKLAENASAAARRESAPRIGRSGSIAVALGSSDTTGRADSLAAGLAALVDSAAPWARPFADSVAFASGLTLAELSAVPGLTGRRPLGFEMPSRQGLTEGVQAAAWTLSMALIAGDSLLSRWAGTGVDLRWDPRERNALVITELIDGRTASGRSCLSGRAESCADWLAISDRAYTAADAREMLKVLFPQEPGRLPGLFGACRQGDDDACLRAGILGHFAASDEARRSLFHFIAARYGPDATRRLLTDHRGTIGTRVTRATGKQPVPLAREWREWLFAEAHWQPVRAGVREAVPALAIVGLMLGLAMRSGRWRA